MLNVKVGDQVNRRMGQDAPLDGVDMVLQVTVITDTEIHCGDWKFSRITGGEIDEELGWDAFHTGSRITGVIKHGLKTILQTA